MFSFVFEVKYDAAMINVNKVFYCHFICEERKKLSALNLKLNVTLLSYPLNISYFHNKTQ